MGCIVECMGEQPKLREMSIYIVHCGMYMKVEYTNVQACEASTDAVGHYLRAQGHVRLHTSQSPIGSRVSESGKKMVSIE